METDEEFEQAFLDRVEASLKDVAEGKVTAYSFAALLIKEFGLEE